MTGGPADRLVKVRYKDHVLFRHVDVERLEVVRREAIGWIVDQDEERIVLVSDRVVGESPIESGPLSSGLVLLRALVESVEEISPLG